MDKEEFRIKLDEINHLVEKKDYKGAMEVVDSIDWRRVKNVRTLCVVGEIYAANKRYEDSRDIFLLAYHRASIGKNILVRLVEVSLKMGEIDEAMDYYEEFCSVAPNDNTAYILRYKILREKNAPLDDQIQVLEEYKSREFTEKWSYELAKLYYRAGQKEKAEDICNEMILWFSEGNYVMKAYDLKMRMGVITDKEKEKLDQQLAQKERAAKKSKEKEEEKKEEPEEPIIEEVIIDNSLKKEDSSEKKEEPEEIREEEISLKDSEEEPEDGEEKEYDGDESEEAESGSEEGGEDNPEDSEGSGEGGSESLEEGGDAESEDLEEGGEEESEDFEEDTDEEEDDEEDSEDGDEETAVDDDSSVIDSIDVSDNRDLNGAESLKERITKSLRSLFGGHRRTVEIDEDEEEDYEDDSEEEYEESEEYDEESDELTEDESEEESTEQEDEEILDSESDEYLMEDDEYPADEEESEEEESEEKIEEDESEDDESEEEYEDEESEEEESIDEEFEDEDSDEDDNFDEDFEEEEPKPSKKTHKKREFRFPEFRIPRSMKKAHIPEVAEKMEILENNKEEKAAEEEPKEEFNLEDTILAAAFAQGIEIPGAEPKKPDTDNENTDSEEDLLTSGENEDESDEPVIIEQMIHSEEEKSIQSLEKNTRNSSDSSKEEEDDDVPDLIMPDLNSPVNEEEDEDEDSDDVSIEETIIEEMVGDSKDEEEDEEEEDEEEESLVSAVMGIQDDDSDKEMDFYDDDDFSEEDLFEDEQIDQFISSIHPESALAPADIIPRDKNLSEEEIKLFSYFVKVPGMKEQIIDALTDVQMESADNTSNRGNIIVMGGPESGKTRLISGLIPAICKELRLEASKVAYVFAEQINGKDMEKIVSRLFGGFLVIENANQLDQETAVNLTKVMEGDTKGMIFILEDDKIGMRKMMARYPKLAKKFTSIINIPVFTNDELANFARIYAMENGYRIDRNGMLALYNLISMSQKEDMPMNVGAVKEIVDSAIQRSQGGIKLFKKNAEKKRMDQDGFIVLYDKDFGK